MINSVLTKDTLPDKAYAGSPAKIMEGVQFYKPISLDEKYEMLKNWLEEFVELNKESLILSQIGEGILQIKNNKDNEVVKFYRDSLPNASINESVFSLANKTFVKTNLLLERQVYKYLYSNKARFLPIG